MASTVAFPSFGRKTNSYTVNGNGDNEKSIEKFENLTVLNEKTKKSKLFLSSSISTNYESSIQSSSSSSSASSSCDEPMTTINIQTHSNDDLRRDSNDSSISNQSENNNRRRKRLITMAKSNNGFISDSGAGSSGSELEIITDDTERKSVMAPPAPAILPSDNCFVSLYCNGKRCMVTVNQEFVAYEQELTTSVTVTDRVEIRLANILAIWTCTCHRISGTKNPLTLCPCITSQTEPPERILEPSKRQRPFVLKLYYAIQNKSQGFKLEMVTLTTFDGKNLEPDQAKAMHDMHMLADIAHRLRNTIENFERPKFLLLFINPYGGSCNGTKIFENKIKPVLELARIKYETVITERANQAREMIINPEIDLNPYDGIICIGGDGMFGEVLNGVMIRTQRENRIDYGCIDAPLKKPRLKLGVVPAGSTDAVVYATAGFKDPINSIIPIVMGQTINIDIGAVHHRDEDRLIRYTASFMGYGFFGDTIQESERLRWLGVKRYLCAGMKKFFSHRLYSGEIKLCIEPSDGSPKDYNPCGINCTTCQRAGIRCRETLNAGDAPACISIRGRFLAINSTIVSGRCGMSKLGMSPMAHVGNGCTDLILVSKCSRLNYLRYLASVAFHTRSPFDFDFVDSYRVREFEFNPIIEPQKRKWYAYEKSVDYDFFDAINDDDVYDDNGIGTSGGTNPGGDHHDEHDRRRSKTSLKKQHRLTSSVWNCDGEVVPEPAIHVKIHCQMISLYAPGFDVKPLADKKISKKK